jgi:prefoldin subunit 5
MTTVNGSIGAAGIGQIDLSSMDIETALMMVQTERTKLLDAQLQTQISEVQARNKQIGKLNDAMNSLNALAGLFKSGKDGNTMMKDGGIPDWNKAGSENDIRYNQMRDAMFSAMEAAGMDLNTDKYKLQIDGGISKVTKGSIDTAIQAIKNQVDAMSNTQQMDMQRLQSMSNKRNEAFDVMTNFVKKMQDSRSAIIGNMR